MKNELEYIKPEQQGLDSKYILNFIKRLQERKINIHSFMIIRKNKVLAEAYYKPFDKEYMHRMYSVSKTFVALAIGLLYTEKRIDLSEKLVDYFPDKVENTDDKWMQSCTIEDALKMALPITSTTYADLKYDDWVWTCFNREKSIKPSGTIFLYNTSATFLLCAIIEKITGLTFLEYLREIFDKIGVSKDIWCVKSPDGYAWGGSGVLCTMRDLAKVGLFVLRKGEWDGEQLIARNYMEKMITKQISNTNNNLFSFRKTCGYGYQTWITDCGFCMTGLGSQLVFGFPKKDFLFVCTADTQAVGDYIGDYLCDLVKYELYEKLEDKELPCVETEHLQKVLSELKADGAWGEKNSEFSEKVNGCRYLLKENVMGWEWFSLHFDGDNGILRFKNVRGEKQIPFLMNEFFQTKFPETHYFDKQIGVEGNREFNCLSSGTWLEEKKFLLRIYITDTCLGSVFISLGFKDNEVGVDMQKIGEFFLDDYEGYAGGRCFVEESNE